MSKEHALHLLKTLEQNYKITTDWKGTKFARIDLAWDYNARHANWTYRISMDGYIANVLLKYGHPSPKKTQLSAHKNRKVIYGVKEQLYPEDDTTPPLDSQGKKRVQGIVGAILYYAQAMDNTWDYNSWHANQTCRISMDGYITRVFIKCGHPSPSKLQLSPHKRREVIYGVKEQLTLEDETTPPLDSQGTKRV